jgi:GT2 family glycosyltransferase
MSPELSVIVVAYRDRPGLEACLESLGSQELDVEALVIDNSPEEGAPQGSYPYPLRYIPTPRNLGYAGGCTLGLSLAQGEFVLFGNADLIFEPGSLQALLSAARQDPSGLYNPLLLLPDGRVNARGNRMHLSGITSCRGLGTPPPESRGCEEVPLLSGAALLGAKELLAELGGLDPLFEMYFEDTDLSLRARAHGNKLYCVLEARVLHRYQLGMNPRKFYFLERNRLLTLLKNLELPTLLSLAPSLLLGELATLIFAVQKGYLSSWIQARLWLLSHTGTALQARRQAQRLRRLPDRYALPPLEVDLPLEQLGPSSKLAQLSRHLFQLLSFAALRGER